MKKKSPFLLATIASLLSFNVDASNAPYELFTLAERETGHLTNDAMHAKLLEDGPIADPRIASYLGDNPQTLSTYDIPGFKLKAIGHEEFDSCIALKTDPCFAEGQGPRNLEEAAGRAIRLSPSNGACWLRDHFSSDFPQPYLSRTYLGLFTDKYVGHIRLSSPNHIMVDNETLMSQDPLKSWAFCIESSAIDLDHRDKGYDSALFVMTANLLKKVAEEAREPASLHVIFNASEEQEFNAYSFSGFNMEGIVLDQDYMGNDTSKITTFPATVSTFEELTSYFTDTLQGADQSRHMIQAKIDLSSYNPKPKLDGIRHLKTTTQ